MAKIEINETGMLINIKNKEVRTPCIIDVNDKELNLIKSQLRSNGINNYKILTPPSNIRINNISFNYRKDPIDNRDYKLKTILKESSSKNDILKSSYEIDYTNEMSPVKNQGHLGSCVAFAVVSVKEWQEQKEHLLEIKQGKKYKRKEKHFDYSEQWLYYKSKEIDCWPNEEGTSIRYALKVLQKQGVPTENAWEYNPSIKGKPKFWAKLISRWALAGKYFRINTPEELCDALRIYGPIPIGVLCFDEIFNVGNNGIVSYPRNPNDYIGGHAICITGFTNDNLFKFKNSWGVNWGENGYGYLSYKYIKDFMLDAWVVEDINVKTDLLRDNM